jgi:ketosteroid isomerase-like protein
MDTETGEQDHVLLVQRLLAAVNRHDLDALVATFSEHYQNETPAHPLRGFTGREQVRHNWAAMLGAVDDLRAELVASAREGDRVWAELRMSGRRRDGSAHEMAGVCIFTVRNEEITAARFYLEPVESASGDVDDAVRHQVIGGAA